MRWRPSRPRCTSLRGANLAPSKECLRRTLHCFQLTRSPNARGGAYNWLVRSKGAGDAPLATPRASRARGRQPRPALPPQWQTAPLRSTAIAPSFRHRPTHLSSARHVRHSPAHAVAPLTPPLHAVAESFHGADPECQRWTHGCFQLSQPADAPGPAQNLLPGCVGVPGGQQGGQGRLTSPAGLPSGPASLGRPWMSVGSEVGIGAFQVISHESAVGLSHQMSSGNNLSGLNDFRAETLEASMPEDSR